MHKVNVFCIFDLFFACLTYGVNKWLNEINKPEDISSGRSLFCFFSNHHIYAMLVGNAAALTVKDGFFRFVKQPVVIVHV